MENYKITKEQILETIRTCTDVTERYFKEIIPEAFKTKLDTGKWYKSSTDIEFLVYYQSNGFYNYGFWEDQPYRDNLFFGDCWYNMSRLATDEEVSAVLINEAKKRGFKNGVTILRGDWYSGFSAPKVTIEKEEEEHPTSGFEFRNDTLFLDGYIIFYSGNWAEIIPQEKTVVPMAKALKIIAKKMKVSPENIEIQY